MDTAGVQIAILVYDGVEAIEAVGPFTVLRRLAGTDAQFVAVEPGGHLAHEPPLILEATRSLLAVPAPDVLVVPGGFGVHQLMDDRHLLAWLRQAHAGSTITAGLSTGSLLLASAGVLDGIEATTHWLTGDELRAYGAHPLATRLVEDGRVVTAMGGSAAIELGLLCARRLAGDAEADRIRAEVSLEPDAFSQARAASLRATLRRWADDTAGDQPPRRDRSRWRRKVVTPPDP
jgi:putative intracellular protease/amidase